MKNLELQKRANDVRKGIVTAVHGAKAGHPGGSLSAADIFTFLYFEEMNIDPQNPDMEERDRFVLSKGHTAPGLYSALAYRGYFPVEDLPTLRHLGSYLQGHPCIHIPGVDMSSGSLGQGISAAVCIHGNHVCPSSRPVPCRLLRKCPVPEIRKTYPRRGYGCRDDPAGRNLNQWQR